MSSLSMCHALQFVTRVAHGSRQKPSAFCWAASRRLTATWRSCCPYTNTRFPVTCRLQWSSRHTVIELAEPDSSTQEAASGVHPAALQHTQQGATHPPGRLKRAGQPSSSELRVQESADESHPSPSGGGSVVRRAVASVQGKPSPGLWQARLAAGIQLAFDESDDCLNGNALLSNLLAQPRGFMPTHGSAERILRACLGCQGGPQLRDAVAAAHSSSSHGTCRLSASSGRRSG